MKKDVMPIKLHHRLNKRRKSIVLVSLKDRQLVLNSEAVKKYPNIENLLQKYEVIYESDFEDTDDFNDEAQTFFRYSFAELRDEASREWYRIAVENEEISANKDTRIHCSLCRTPNRYIFYIKNKLNKSEMNVGSDCIEKFKNLNDGNDIATIRVLKRKRESEFRRIDRINTFNAKYPNVESKIKAWKTDYENLPILMPAHIHNRFQELINESQMFYINYINGRLQKSTLDMFEKFIEDYKKQVIDIEKWIEENQNKRFICDREIAIWLQEKNQSKFLDQIIRDDGYYTKVSIDYIYEDNFINKFIDEFRLMIKEQYWTLEKISNQTVIFRYHIPKWQSDILFSCTTKAFMGAFGKSLFENGSTITEKDIVGNTSLVWSIENIRNVIDRFNFACKKPYTLELHFSREEIELTDKGNKMYTTVQARIFCEAQKNLLTKDIKVMGDSLVSLLKNQIKSWRPLSDKKKYNVGRINVDPTKAKHRIEKD